MIRNPQAQALPSSITAEEFGRAMASIDWQAIPPHNRKRAMAAHLVSILLATTTDPTLASRLASPK